MSTIQKIALIITIIGGITWGILGIFNFNVISFLFQEAAFFTRTIYIIVGIASVINIGLFALTDD